MKVEEDMRSKVGARLNVLTCGVNGVRDIHLKPKPKAAAVQLHRGRDTNEVPSLHARHHISMTIYHCQ